jgi:membrane-bound metal-dependent hydrolase YbcI (DUF457 family)
MDVVSHGLFGWVLGQLDARQTFGPGSRAAFVLGALAPDVDLVTAVGGWDRYLYVHETGTHTIAATPIVALAVALVVRRFTKESRFGRLWFAATASALFGHLIFDLVSGSEMRLLAPFAGARWGPQWLAMADLLAIGVLAIGTMAGRYWPRAAGVWTFIGLVMLLVVKAYSQSLVAEVLALKEPGLATGKQGAKPEAVNGSLVEWTIHLRDGRTLRTVRVNVRTGTLAVRGVRQVDADAEALGAQLIVPGVTRFLDLARLPFPRIENNDGRRFLFWSDLRHCDAARCALSFGAELGPSGQPLREVIRIGPFEQNRSLAGRPP